MQVGRQYLTPREDLNQAGSKSEIHSKVGFQGALHSEVTSHLECLELLGISGGGHSRVKTRKVPTLNKVNLSDLVVSP